MSLASQRMNLVTRFESILKVLALLQPESVAELLAGNQAELISLSNRQSVKTMTVVGDSMSNDTIASPGWTSDLSVVVVTYNSRGEVAKCLESFSRIVLEFRLKVEVRIMDNNSTDGTREWLQQNAQMFPSLNLRLNLNKKNIGLSNAVNEELARCNSDMVLICNPDVVFTSGFIHLLNFSRQHPEFGVVPELRNLDGTVQRVTYRRFPTVTRILMDFTGLGIHFSRYIFSWVHDDYCYVDYKFNEPVDFLEQPGASFLLLHKDTAKKLSPFFDPQFPVLWNDVDMALRARLLGIRFVIMPGVKIYHELGHSMKSVNHSRGALLFFSQHGLIGFARKWNLHPRILQASIFLDAVFSFPLYVRVRGVREATELCVAVSRSIFL